MKLHSKHERNLVSKLSRNKISYAVIPVAGCKVPYIQTDKAICSLNRLGTVFSNGGERTTIDEFIAMHKPTTDKE